MHFNVAAGKGGANFNDFIYFWVSCEFPFRINRVLSSNNTSSPVIC